MREDISPINQDDIDAVLAFIPLLTAPDFKFGEWQTPEGQFPQYIFNEESNRFINALGKLTFAFDWPAWKDEAIVLIENHDALKRADLLTLRKLITTHLRAERFNEGHLAAQFENGHLLGILERLKEVREQV
jgi:hypothetical protein